MYSSTLAKLLTNLFKRKLFLLNLFAEIKCDKAIYFRLVKIFRKTALLLSSEIDEDDF